MRKWLGLVAGLAMSSMTWAGVEAVTPPKDAEAAIKKLGPVMKVEGWFKGPGNLLGVAARFNGQPMVFFTDPQGRYMMSGTAIELATGKNLIADGTAQFFAAESGVVSQALALPNPSKIGIDKITLDDFKGISQGKAATGKKAYIIFDFACGHCMRLYQELSKEKISGEIKWIPVTFSGELATSKAALALGLGKIEAVAGLSGKALSDAMLANKEALGRGALAAESNTQLAQGQNIGSTPYFIYERSGVLVGHEGYASTSGLAKALGVQ